MSVKTIMRGAGIALISLTASAAYCGTGDSSSAAPVAAISDAKLGEIVAGQSTKAQIRSLLGTPWRVVQFNDCGDPMPGQADETWEYRGRDSSGTYRFHVEFDENDVAQLVAKIPDQTLDGRGTLAKIGAAEPMMGMPM